MFPPGTNQVILLQLVHLESLSMQEIYFDYKFLIILIK